MTKTRSAVYSIIITAALNIAFFFCNYYPRHIVEINGDILVSVFLTIANLLHFAMMGFIKYNGMTAEQFVWAWIKSEFLMPKKLMFNPDNLYYETLKTTIQSHEKGICPVAKKPKKAKRSKEVKNAENS